MKLDSFFESLREMSAAATAALTIGAAPHRRDRGTPRRRTGTARNTPGAFGRMGRGRKRRAYRVLPEWQRRRTRG